MSTNSKVNWDYARIQYELLGVDKKDLAQSLGVDQRILQTKIDECNWKASDVSLPTISIDSIGEAENLAEKMVELAKQRVSVLSAIKQCSVYPEYMAIEQLLLNKVRDSVVAVEPGGSDSAKELATLTSVYSKLLQHNALSVLKNTALEEADTGLIVQIVNNVDTN